MHQFENIFKYNTVHNIGKQPLREGEKTHVVVKKYLPDKVNIIVAQMITKQSFTTELTDLSCLLSFLIVVYVNCGINYWERNIVT